MKVILQQKVQKLGGAGDIVEAAPGYFRNYLEPRGLAVLASPGALKKREEDLENLRKKAEKAHEEAVALGERITAVGSVKIKAKAGEGGKLYGKVTNKEVAQALKEALAVAIDKRSVKLPEDIGSLGTFRAQVKLTPEVQAEVVVEVVSE